MSTVGMAEARNRPSELVERAVGGEETVITRRGEPVARLMPSDVLPLDVRNTQGQARAVAERIRRSRAGQALGAAASIRQMIEEGRC